MAYAFSKKYKSTVAVEAERKAIWEQIPFCTGKPGAEVLSTMPKSSTDRVMYFLQEMHGKHLRRFGDIGALQTLKVPQMFLGWNVTRKRNHCRGFRWNGQHHSASWQDHFPQTNGTLLPYWWKQHLQNVENKTNRKKPVNVFLSKQQKNVLCVQKKQARPDVEISPSPRVAWRRRSWIFSRSFFCSCFMAFGVGMVGHFLTLQCNQQFRRIKMFWINPALILQIWGEPNGHQYLWCAI